MLSKLTRLLVAVALSGALLGGRAAAPESASAHDGCGDQNWKVGQVDWFFTAPGSTRLHGWVVQHECRSGGGTYLGERFYQFGQDSRYCDGCAYKNVSKNSVKARSWVCGTLWYNPATRTNTSSAYLNIVSPWKHYGGCGPQADSGTSGLSYWEVTGSWKHSYYLDIP